MPKYYVRRTVYQSTEVEADNEAEALRILKEEYAEEDFETFDDDFELEVDDD